VAARSLKGHWSTIGDDVMQRREVVTVEGFYQRVSETSERSRRERGQQ
jgi:hypothetical protein